jgi:hypothetical protein
LKGKELGVIEVREVTKRCGRTVAVDRLTFDVVADRAARAGRLIRAAGHARRGSFKPPASGPHSDLGRPFPSSNSDMVRQALVTDGGPLITAPPELARPLLGNSSITAEGPEHLSNRLSSDPSDHDHVARYSPVMRLVCRRP